MAQRPLNVGLVGGGGGAFIVNPHQKAIHFDGTRKVAMAALHPDPEVALKEAENWAYPIKGFRSYDEMIENAEENQLDYILIVTPNFVHYDPAKKALEKGIPVFCEKPLTIELKESEDLVRLVNEKKVPFCTAHTYLGHWTSWLSRHIVRSGLLGEIRWVDASYIQGWLASRTEDQGVMQAEWRVDPKRAGKSCCGGDIGTHALMQLRYVTGLDIKRLLAHLETFVERRQLDDHFTTYCELSNGAKAMVRASQISSGHKNDLRLEVCGEKGSLYWEQENPECVQISLAGQPVRTYWRGEAQPNDGFLQDLPDDLIAEASHIPPGHPEAFHDAFARLHRSFEKDVRAYQNGTYQGTDGSKYATVEDGMIGIKFIEKAVESSEKGNIWVDM